LNIRPSLWLDAARDAAGHQQHPPGALYVVATPIGNLADLTLRALYVLSAADLVACEDTRVTGGLLQRLDLRRPLLALHAHNEHEAATQVLDALAQGRTVVLVSDAGTPAVSDPGARVVARARAAGYRVVPVPGVSSVMAALSVAGDDVAGHDGSPGGFRFVGFLPAKGAERAQALQALAADAAAQVVFEAPHRVADLAEGMARALGPRPLTVGRELTKQFESIETMPAEAWPAWLAADASRQRGEFVVVVHARAVVPEAAGEVPPAVERALRALLPRLPLKEAVALTVELTGSPRNAVYARALALRDAEG
jgi:16S rRNA (cytidine1402-2'-O)-methyltransferase